MLINYIRTPKRLEAKIDYSGGTPKAVLVQKGNDPYGVIISTERGKVGWAICAPWDYYKKDMGFTIAKNRADYYGTNKEKLLKEAPESIRPALIAMYERSNRYFK